MSEHVSEALILRVLGVPDICRGILNLTVNAQS